MPRLKLMVESAIHRYLTDQLTDEGFKESILSILNEFKGKNLLHQTSGNKLGEWKKRTPVCAQIASLRKSGFYWTKATQELEKTSTVV